MGRVPIASEYKTGEGGDRFPKVKLQEKGEKTRFTIIELPWKEYVHYLKSPTFDDNGRPVKETKKRRDGTEYTDYKLTFEGSPICLGDEAVLKDKGVDEKNCPACEASVKSGGDIPGPQQRFAVNVIEYALRGNTWDIKKPFSAEIKIWSFSGRIYDEIEGLQKQIGDLRQHDITLECIDPFYQNNKLAFQMEPGYKSGDKAYIKELLTTPGNKATEQQLKDACGRDVPRQRLDDDCAHVLRQWRKLRNEGQDSGYDTGGEVNLDGGIDALMDDENVKAETKHAAVGGGGGDPLGEFTEEATSNPSPAAASKKESASAKETEPGTGESSPASTPTASPSEKAADPTETSSATSTDKSPASSGSASSSESGGSEAAGDDFNFDDLMSEIG
jgi:hypothetical protein